MSTIAEVVIDSHVHMWDRGRFTYPWLDAEPGSLQRNFLPRDLAAHQSATPLPVAGSVCVQADCTPSESLAEALWFQELADAGAPFVGVVAAAQLELSDGRDDHLAALAQIPLVVGVRRLLQDEGAGFARSADFVHGVRALSRFNLTMDLCVRSWQLGEVIELVDACPEVVFVLDHLGKPTLDRDAYGVWASNLALLARRPNVTCKLSGLATEAPKSMRNARALQPWVLQAIEVFGAERCMFGSDWPVVTAVEPYAFWVDVVLAAISDLSASERAAVLGGTALATYDSRRHALQSKES